MTSNITIVKRSIFNFLFAPLFSDKPYFLFSVGTFNSRPFPTHNQSYQKNQHSSAPLNKVCGFAAFLCAFASQQNAQPPAGRFLFGFFPSYYLSLNNFYSQSN